jgi:hypothetical protein
MDKPKKTHSILAAILVPAIGIFPEFSISAVRYDTFEEVQAQRCKETIDAVRQRHFQPLFDEFARCLALKADGAIREAENELVKRHPEISDEFDIPYSEYVEVYNKLFERGFGTCRTIVSRIVPLLQNLKDQGVIQDFCELNVNYCAVRPDSGHVLNLYKFENTWYAIDPVQSFIGPLQVLLETMQRDAPKTLFQGILDLYTNGNPTGTYGEYSFGGPDAREKIPEMAEFFDANFLVSKTHDVPQNSAISPVHQEFVKHLEDPTWWPDGSSEISRLLTENNVNNITGTLKIDSKDIKVVFYQLGSIILCACHLSPNPVFSHFPLQRFMIFVKKIPSQNVQFSINPSSCDQEFLKRVESIIGDQNKDQVPE